MADHDVDRQIRWPLTTVYSSRVNITTAGLSHMLQLQTHEMTTDLTTSAPHTAITVTSSLRAVTSTLSYLAAMRLRGDA